MAGSSRSEEPKTGSEPTKPPGAGRPDKPPLAELAERIRGWANSVGPEHRCDFLEEAENTGNLHRRIGDLGGIQRVVLWLDYQGQVALAKRISDKFDELVAASREMDRLFSRPGEQPRSKHTFEGSDGDPPLTLTLDKDYEPEWQTNKVRGIAESLIVLLLAVEDLLAGKGASPEPLRGCLEEPVTRRESDCFLFVAIPEGMLDFVGRKLDGSGEHVFHATPAQETADALCRLFGKEYRPKDPWDPAPAFTSRRASDIPNDERVLLEESLWQLAIYDDPDPGVYEPRPTRLTMVLAEYARRARTWEGILASEAAAAKEKSVPTPDFVNRLSVALAVTVGIKEIDTISHLYPTNVNKEEMASLRNALVQWFTATLKEPGFEDVRKTLESPEMVNALESEGLCFLPGVVGMFHPAVATAGAPEKVGAALEKIVSDGQRLAPPPIDRVFARVSEIEVLDCRIPHPEGDPTYQEPRRFAMLLQQYWGPCRTLILDATDAPMAFQPNPLLTLIVNVRPRIDACFTSLASVPKADETRDIVHYLLDTLASGDPDELTIVPESTRAEVAKVDTFVAEARLAMGSTPSALTHAEHAFITIFASGAKEQRLLVKKKWNEILTKLDADKRARDAAALPLSGNQPQQAVSLGVAKSSIAKPADVPPPPPEYPHRESSGWLVAPGTPFIPDDWWPFFDGSSNAAGDWDDPVWAIRATEFLRIHLAMLAGEWDQPRTQGNRVYLGRCETAIRLAMNRVCHVAALYLTTAECDRLRVAWDAVQAGQAAFRRTSDDIRCAGGDAAPPGVNLVDQYLQLEGRGDNPRLVEILRAVSDANPFHGNAEIADLLGDLGLLARLTAKLYQVYKEKEGDTKNGATVAGGPTGESEAGKSEAEDTIIRDLKKQMYGLADRLGPSVQPIILIGDPVPNPSPNRTHPGAFMPSGSATIPIPASREVGELLNQARKNGVFSASRFDGIRERMAGRAVDGDFGRIVLEVIAWLREKGHTIQGCDGNLGGQARQIADAMVEEWQAANRTSEPAVAGVQPPSGSQPQQAAPPGGAKLSSAEMADAPRLKEPNALAREAYRLHFVSGFTQTAIATMMSEEHGRKIVQGQVSKWVNEVREYVEAGNILPDPEVGAERGKVQSKAPRTLDYQEKPDGRFRPLKSPQQRDGED
ncbi:MAG: hypothetical protein NT031_15585 [Planctomycetota bacterium]|nr:hypothetical protein [Planctomycetota bacterium]